MDVNISIYDETPTETCSEKRLWAAVLLMFIKDVAHDRYKMVQSSNGICAGLRDKLNLHKQVATYSESVKFACEVLDRNHPKFVKMIHDIADGKKTPEFQSRIIPEFYQEKPRQPQ